MNESLPIPTTDRGASLTPSGAIAPATRMFPMTTVPSNVRKAEMPREGTSNGRIKESRWLL